MEIVPSELPDVTKSSAPRVESSLEWVGMTEIAQPIIFKASGGEMRVPAKLALGVSLRAQGVRGVHMSRLYIAAQEALGKSVVDWRSLGQLLKTLVAGQEGLSDSGSLRLSWELPVLRSALVSDLKGWRLYPVEMGVRLSRGKLRYQAGIQLLYSSTCPCSAALARQLSQSEFKRQFREPLVPSDEVALWLSEENSVAGTPHAQRSVARVRVEWEAPEAALSVEGLIDQLEAALGTPVQTAVKRVDEQAFARLNAENLMFCEDAARRLKDSILGLKGVTNWWAQVEHQESLHAHNAVAETMMNPSDPLRPY